MRAEHIIFDLDGTLWDPTEVSMEAWRRACTEHGIDPAILDKKNFAKAFGHLMEDVATIVLPGIDDKEARGIIDMVSDEENKLITTGIGTLFDDVAEILHTLHTKGELFICSNCQAGYIEAFLSTYDLGHLFNDTICPGDTGEAKPENLRILMARHHMKQAIMIGDMESDKEAARANRVPFIHAAYGFGNVKDFDYRITRFSELLDILG